MVTASHALWKGAISSGPVHIPVSLHSTTGRGGVDFDWLDRRTMDPVGYRRVNKKTGREVDQEQIVKGVECEPGKYTVLGPEGIAAVYPESTGTIANDGFVAAAEIPVIYLDRPYCRAPAERGGKAYALLREALLRSGRIGIARVVSQARQYLAARVASGPGLVLDLLRWNEDVRSRSDLDLPPVGAKAAGLNERELAMAERLVDDMASAGTAARKRVA